MVRTLMWLLVVCNVIAYVVLKNHWLDSQATSGSPISALPEFQLVSELPPPEPVCYRLGRWQGAALQAALQRWFEALNIHPTEHSQSGDTPTVEVWVEANKSQSEDVKARLSQALAPPITQSESGKHVRFLVGRFLNEPQARELEKKLKLRLFKVSIIQPSLATASGYYEFQWPAESPRPMLDDRFKGLAGADQLTIETCPEDSGQTLKPWQGPKAPETDSAKLTPATV